MNQPMTDKLYINMRTNKKYLKLLTREKIEELVKTKQLNNRYYHLEPENQKLNKQ